MVERAGSNLDEDLVGSRHGPRSFVGDEDLGTTMLMKDDSSHLQPPYASRSSAYFTTEDRGETEA
jgi:hypothetical protein